MRRLLPLLAATAACSGAPVPGRDAAPPPGDARRPADGGRLVTFAPAPLPLSKIACVAHRLPSGSDTAAVTRRRQDLVALRDIGVGTIREDLRWRKVEPTPATFDFRSEDPRVRDVRAFGMEHVLMLGYGNPWATTRTASDEFFPPDDPATFGRFAGAAAREYRGKVRLYEIWNEPNAGYRFWRSNPKGDPAAYAALLAAAAGAIRAADPSARVIFGGPFYPRQFIPGHLDFLAAAYRARPDLGRWFDGMGLHPYGIYPPSAAPESSAGDEEPIDLKVARVRALMARHGDGDTPIFTTEMGWPSWGDVSELDQARYLVRGFLLLAAAGSRLVCWYTLREPVTHAVAPERHFGLLGPDADRTDGTPPRKKPAYLAYRTLLRTLGAFRITRRLDPAPGVRAFALTGPPPAQAVVLWRPSGTEAPVRVRVPAGSRDARVVELTGATRTVTAAGTTLRVLAGPSPRYVVFR